MPSASNGLLRAALLLLLRALLSWLLLWSFVFGLLRLLSPDPVTIIAGLHTDAATRAFLEKQFGLDLPVWKVWGETLLRTLILDFGSSRRIGLPVMSLLAEPLRISLTISFVGALAAALAGASAFALAARVGSRVEGWFRAVATGLSAVPGFLLALLISRSKIPAWLDLPAYGLDPSTGGLGALFLPTACATIPVLSYALLRSLACYHQVVSALWFRTARALGSSRADATLRFGWPYLLLALGDAGVNSFLLCLTGSIAIEYVFGVPGLGTSMMDAIQLRDAPVILAIVSIVGLLTIGLSAIREIGHEVIGA